MKYDLQKSSLKPWHFQANIYLFKVNSGGTKKRCEIRSKLTLKTTERRH